MVIFRCYVSLPEGNHSTIDPHLIPSHRREYPVPSIAALAVMACESAPGATEPLSKSIERAWTCYGYGISAPVTYLYYKL